MASRYSLALTRGTFTIEKSDYLKLSSAAANGEQFVSIRLDIVGDGREYCEALVGLAHVISVISIADVSEEERGESSRKLSLVGKS